VAPGKGGVTAAPALPSAPTLANSLEQEVGFSGITEDGVAPPDTWVARGAGDVVESVNLDVAISTRSGAPIKKFSLNSFYSGVNTDSGLSDPRIEFDDSSSRWFTSIVTITANSNSTQNSVLMAVSNTSDPTGTWTIYHVDGPRPTNRTADQPRLGFSSDKVVIAYEDFDESHGCLPASSCHDDILWVLQLSDLVAGGSVHATRFNTTNGLAHPFGIVPAIPLDSAETTTAYAAYNETHVGGHNAAILVITGTPAAGTTAYNDIETGINGTSSPPPAHQPGGLQNIDTGDDRFLSASVSQATGGLGAVIWITLGDKCKVAGSDQACVRGLRVAVDSTGSTLTKTWEQEFGVAGSDLYYPAIVGDAAGDHAFLTYTISSPTEFPTSEAFSVFPSNGAQNQRMDYAAGTQGYTGCPCRTGTSLSRWGDYSGVWADDASGTSVWVATEFGAISGDSWATQVAEFTLDAPVVTGLSPSSGVVGTLVAVFGANFTSSSFVAFGGVPAPVVTFAGSSELIVRAPPQAAGAVDVTVTSLKGTSPLDPPGDLYTYPAILWASLPAANDVTMIDTSSDSLITPPLSFGSAMPGGIATLPDDSEALVVDTTDDLLVPITTMTRSLGPPATAGPAPLDVAVRPDGALAYVTNPTSITPIRIMGGGALQPLAPINVPGSVRLTGIAITPDGTHAYVTDPSDSKVWIIALKKKGGGAVSGTLSMDFPTGIAVNGSVGFVTIDLGPSAPGIVLSFSTSTNTILDSVPVGLDPRRVTISPTGGFVYVSNTGDGTVTAIQHSGPGSDSVVATMPLGPGPIGLAMTPDGSTGYAALSGSGNIGQFASPPGPLSSFPSGGTDPEQLAIATPSPVICQPGGVTPLLVSESPASVAPATPYTEVDHLGFCPGAAGTLTVTVKTSWAAVPTGAVAPTFAPATWTLGPGENSRFVQRLAPTTAGTYTLRVRIFGPGNTLLTSQEVSFAVT
jgi:DNA-binding beta-propeller fold protein YncE